MRFVPRFSRLLPPFLWRPAVFLAAIAQLAVGLAPLAEMREGANARAHVEANGIELHHAHDESTCIVSIAQHLLAGAVPTTSRPDVSTIGAARVVDSSRELVESSLSVTTRSRAPPETGLTG
jgi:hypothetical protein